MKYKIAFICVHNSCRSQMAEAWMNKLGNDIFEVYSAGTEKYNEVKPLALEVMKNEVDMSLYRPKLVSEIPKEVDVLITMGCNVVCPYLPNKYTEDWGLDDPSGGSLEDFEKTKKIIRIKVIELIEKIKTNKIKL